MGLFDKLKANRAAGKGIFGKQGGFGSGQGAISQAWNVPPKPKPKSSSERRAESAIASGEGIVPAQHSDMVGEYNTGLQVSNPPEYQFSMDKESLNQDPNATGIGQSFLHTGNIDFDDKEQVMQIQKSLVQSGDLPATYIDKKTGEVKSNIDGVFGPNTEGAYRTAINARREGAGFGSYKYDNLLDNATDSGDPVQEAQGQGSAPQLDAPAANTMSVSQYNMLNPQNPYSGGDAVWDPATKQYMMPEDFNNPVLNAKY